MYHVWPVFWAFCSELFVPYSPVPMEPSMAAVFHWADAGKVRTMTVAMRMRLSRGVRRLESSQIPRIRAVRELRTMFCVAEIAGCGCLTESSCFKTH